MSEEESEKVPGIHRRQLKDGNRSDKRWQVRTCRTDPENGDKGVARIVQTELYSDFPLQHRTDALAQSPASIATPPSRFGFATPSATPGRGW